MDDHNGLVAAYEVDVRFPDVSGMEHLDMLITRSRIAAIESELSVEQRARLRSADQTLLRQADRFYTAIQQVADLAEWRAQEQVSPAEWWWYLDVVASLPLTVDRDPGATPETQVVAG